MDNIIVLDHSAYEISFLRQIKEMIAQKSKPLLNYKKIVLNHIKVGQWNFVSSSN